MGGIANRWPVSALLLLITVIITGLNIYLLYGAISGLF
jgi:Mn2+/Fe2+ NRAMP family transporter